MKSTCLTALAFFAGSVGLAPLHAQDPNSEAPMAEASVADAESQDVSLPAPVSDEELSGQRGGQAVVVADQRLTGIATGNVINGDFVAGDVTLSGNSLSSFTGLGNFIVNTGAQLNMQAGINVSLNISE